MRVTLLPGQSAVLPDVLMVGADAGTQKDAADVTVVSGMATEIVPVEAPDGTVARIVVSLGMLNEAEVPVNLTEVAVVKPEPFRVTEVPGAPPEGEKEVSVKAGWITRMVYEPWSFTKTLPLLPAVSPPILPKLVLLPIPSVLVVL